MQNVDYKQNGTITYSEFLAATVPVEEVLTDLRLKLLFKHFDIDNTDYISSSNLREAFC